MALPKKVGNRANNYFPKEWRIRKSVDPDRFFHPYRPRRDYSVS
ncbi:hypothetical protein AB9P05_07090 [Roseivirga sp. BDSF3-8]